MVRAGSRTSSPSVAIRAYPANAKNNSPAAWSTPPTGMSDGSARFADRAPPELSTTATTASSTASTTPTMTRVSSADFCTPV
jgi:hypothetical protein